MHRCIINMHYFRAVCCIFGTCMAHIVGGTNVAQRFMGRTLQTRKRNKWLWRSHGKVGTLLKTRKLGRRIEGQKKRSTNCRAASIIFVASENQRSCWWKQHEEGRGGLRGKYEKQHVDSNNVAIRTMRMVRSHSRRENSGYESSQG